MFNGFEVEEYSITEERFDLKLKTVFLFKLKCNDALDNYIQTRANDFRRENPKVTFKGFRKGKEPVELIMKNWGNKYFFHTIISMVIDTIDLFKSTLINDIDFIDDIEYSIKESLVVKAVVSRFQEVEVDDFYKGMKIDRLSDGITDEAIEEELIFKLNNRRSIGAEKEKVEEGDYVTFSCIGHIGDSEVKIKTDDYSIVIGDKDNDWPNELLERFVGVSVGDDFMCDVVYPDTYTEVELAGKSVKFGIGIKEIRQIVVPELDDKLARLYGYYRFEEFKTAVIEELKTRKIELNR